LSSEENAMLKRSETNQGLTKEDVEKRFQKYGKNVVSEARPRTVLFLLRKFWGIVPWMLEIAIIIDRGHRLAHFPSSSWLL
jgi:H+-transporting ATPase